MMMMGCLDFTVVPLKNDDIIEKQLLKCVAAQNLPRTKLLNPTISCELCTAMTQIFRSLQSKEDERS